MVPLHLIVGIIFIVITYRFTNWKKWNTYYSTMQFFIIGDLLYNFLFYNCLLWEYVCPLFTHKEIALIWAFIYFPCTILFFFSKYPRDKDLKKQIMYVSFWSIIYSLLELGFCYLGYFKYYYGWSIWWSFGFNLLIFPILAVHHRKPLLAWGLAIVLLIIVVLYFHSPIKLLR